jgi:mRNA interferase HicA
VKRQALLAHLHAHGCVLIREGANHSWYGHAESQRRSSVPRHKEINDLLALKICKDLGVPKPR